MTTTVVRELFPILSSPDLDRLVGFYCSAFSAEIGYRFPDVGEPQYVSLRVGTVNMGISPDPAAPAADAAGRVSLWFYVDDCAVAYGAALGAGASAVSPPEDMPWGERVAEVADPDGNRLHLGQAPAE
jgi:uncharacterized glyoxalase superfamily protein PhnB